MRLKLVRGPTSRTTREANEANESSPQRWGMMADGGGTFRCATMLCGNNAQTNDSAVPTVITRGTRSFFPPPPISWCYHSVCTLRSSLSCCLFIFPSAFTLAHCLSTIPSLRRTTPFSLLWLLNQRTSATTIDPPSPTLSASIHLYRVVHQCTGQPSRSLSNIVVRWWSQRGQERAVHQSSTVFLQDFLCAS